MLGGICASCGDDTDLEFDHIDPGTKSFTIGKRLDGPWEGLVAEAAKCQLLCDPCHRAKSSKDSFRRYTHGTPSFYRKGCRCPECREAQSAYKRELRARKRHSEVADR